MPGLADLLGRRSEMSAGIPVVPHPALGFGVYYAPAYPPLSEAGIAAAVPAWVASHVPPPLGPALIEWIAANPLSLNDMAKTALPLPPHSHLRGAGGMGPEEERRLDRAFQLLVISAAGPNQVPRFALWAALAGALSAAEQLQGVVYDREAWRLFPAGGFSIPAEGQVAAGRLLTLMTPPGGGAMTRGMALFGLPEVHAAGDRENAGPLALVAAQFLAEEVLRGAAAAGAPVDEVRVGGATLGPEVAARALGAVPAGWAAPSVGFSYLAGASPWVAVAPLPVRA